MITEDYVSFEIAKLLKAKGFDELCNKKYNGYKIIVPAGRNIELWQNSEFDVDEECSAPTFQMAMKWLREAHHIHIATEPYAGYETHACFIWKNGMGINWQNSFHTFKTYEEACEEAIKFSLKYLI